MAGFHHEYTHPELWSGMLSQRPLGLGTTIPAIQSARGPERELTHSPPLTSLVIVTYNSNRFIAPLLRSLTEVAAGSIQDTVVVDNASTDGTINVLSELSITLPNFRVIRNTSNLGLRAALNQGISLARYEIVIVSNPDVVIQDNSFLKCIGLMASDGQIAIVTPPSVSPVGGITRLGTRIGAPFLWSAGEVSDTDIGRERGTEVDLGGGSFFILRRSAFNKVGGYDPDLFLMGEEEELSAKVRHEGYRVVFFPQAKITHFGGASIRTAADPRRLNLECMIHTPAILYRRYCCDGFAKRGLWHTLLLEKALAYALANKSAVPLTQFFKSTGLKVKFVRDLTTRWNLRMIAKAQAQHILAVLLPSPVAPLAGDIE